MTKPRYTVNGAFSSAVPRNSVDDFSPGHVGTAVSTTVPSDEIVERGAVSDSRVSGKNDLKESRLIDRLGDLRAEGSNKDEVIDVYHRLVRHYLSADKLSHAERALEGALAFAKKTYGEDDAVLAPIYIELAFVNYKLSAFLKAKSYLEPALALQEKEHGKVSEQVAFVVHKLGRVYEALGDSVAAESHYLRAVTIYQNAFSEDDSQIIVARTDLHRVRRKRKTASK